MKSIYIYLKHLRKFLSSHNSCLDARHIPEDLLSVTGWGQPLQPLKRSTLEKTIVTLQNSSLEGFYYFLLAPDLRS